MTIQRFSGIRDTGQPSFLTPVTLDGTPYRFRLRWRPRCLGWYLDLFDVSGVPIFTGRRLDNGAILNLAPGAIEDAPLGLIYVVGPNGSYDREALGRTLVIYYLTEDDLTGTLERVRDKNPSLYFS